MDSYTIANEIVSHCKLYAEFFTFFFLQNYHKGDNKVTNLYVRVPCLPFTKLCFFFGASTKIIGILFTKPFFSNMFQHSLNTNIRRNESTVRHIIHHFRFDVNPLILFTESVQILFDTVRIDNPIEFGKIGMRRA